MQKRGKNGEELYQPVCVGPSSASGRARRQRQRSNRLRVGHAAEMRTNGTGRLGMPCSARARAGSASPAGVPMSLVAGFRLAPLTCCLAMPICQETARGHSRAPAKSLRKSRRIRSRWHLGRRQGGGMAGQMWNCGLAPVAFSCQGGGGQSWWLLMINGDGDRAPDGARCGAIPSSTSRAEGDRLISRRRDGVREIASGLRAREVNRSVALSEATGSAMRERVGAGTRGAARRRRGFCVPCGGRRAPTATAGAELRGRVWVRRPRRLL